MTTEQRQSIVFGHAFDAEPSVAKRIDPLLRRFTAKFVDAALEDRFQEEQLTHATRAFLQVCLPVAAAAFLGYGIHDALVVPEIRAEALGVRYGLFVPALVVSLGLVFSRHLVKWHQAAVLLFGMSVNGVVLWIGAHAARDGFFIYTSFAILFVTLGAFIARMSVANQLLYTVLTMALYNALDVASAHSSGAVRASMNLTFFSMGAIGTLAAYHVEKQARLGFWQRTLIEDQVRELEAERQRADSLLLNILPAPIARRLKRDSRAVAEGFPEVTVMFADIVGFTKMSARLQPEELVRRLNQIFSAFDDMADELGLEKIKTIGDAYMVVGGLVDRSSRDHAPAAAEMALRMVRHVTEYGQKIGEEGLSIRIGIHTGPVVAGVIGKRKFIYDVWGDTVNTASRMESHGVPGQIQVTEQTRALLAPPFELQERGEIEVKGKGTMRAWILVRSR